MRIACQSFLIAVSYYKFVSSLRRQPRGENDSKIHPRHLEDWVYGNSQHTAETDQLTFRFSTLERHEIEDAIYNPNYTLDSDQHIENKSRTNKFARISFSVLCAMMCIMLIVPWICIPRDNCVTHQTSGTSSINFVDVPEVIEFELNSEDEEDFDQESSMCGSYSLSDPLWQGHLWKMNSTVAVGNFDAMYSLEKSWFRRWFLLSYGKSKDSNNPETTGGLKLFYYSEKDDKLELFSCIRAGSDISEAPPFKLSALNSEASQKIQLDMYGYDIAFMITDDKGRPFATYDDWRQQNSQILPKKFFPFIFHSLETQAQKPDCLVSSSRSDGNQRILAFNSGKSRKAWLNIVHRALDVAIKHPGKLSSKQW